MFDLLGENRKNVLILGDGDFSFTKALICKFGHDSNLNIIATVYDDETECYFKYPNAKQNVGALKSSGVELLFKIDATRLDECNEIENKKFDLIIFNFPHTGGKTNLKLCRQLLKGIFLGCSSLLSNDTSRLCITLTSGQSGLGAYTDVYVVDSGQLPCHNKDSWQVIYLSAYANLLLDKVVQFPSTELASIGYKCTGYKNVSRQFHTDHAETFIFRQSCDVTPENLHTPTADLIEDEAASSNLHNFRPFYIHDIAFWVNDEFQLDFFESKCRHFSKGLIKRIQFQSEYSLNDDRYADRRLRTLCFRLTWQSTNYAMTRESCRDMQILLRDHLTRNMPHSTSFSLR